MDRDIMHQPEPGPIYWDWRCLRCGEPVSKHAPWWRRLVGPKPDVSGAE
jgi:hypothetical protein